MPAKTFPIFIVPLIIIISTLLASFLPPSQKDPSRASKIPVVTSIYPLFFFAQEIGGDKVNLINLTPPGLEPHDYEPTARDLATIEQSRLLILSGGFEPWADKIRANLKEKSVRILVAGENLGIQSADPHVWLSPTLAKAEAERIADTLTQIDPQNEAYYQTNSQNLHQELDVLEAAYRQSLANCARRDFITSHAAFGHLAQAYGLNQIPIAGLSPDEEPSPKQLAEITNLARSRRVNYIFFESLTSPKLSETLASEIGAQILVLDPLEGLSEKAIMEGKTYFTVMQDNLANLKIALQCTK